MTYQCDLCSKKFKHGKNLTKHYKTHQLKENLVVIDGNQIDLLFDLMKIENRVLNILEGRDPDKHEFIDDLRKEFKKQR